MLTTLGSLMSASARLKKVSQGAIGMQQPYVQSIRASRLLTPSASTFWASVTRAKTMAMPLCYSNRLRKILAVKNMAEYEERLVRRAEAEIMMKDTERFMAFVESQLPER